ncbi:hypothetical protein [Reichenbachiella ulvae]|uniref:N-acetyltransferase domain-containing protein n=1 Tax=Reichenbachiella ulvae TaxID=2980104 RepID=A0ABT3CYS8_9BACT|nr:hypothetical protein [Reichenbachiella ulvae]MCV9388841.1 hypothetical protein [Reichenbachiella ulvae]
MKLIEVSTQEEAEEFVHFAVRLYRQDRFWIRPLDQDIEWVFDKQKNKTFGHGYCTRWLLKRDGETIGRIAAFINGKTAHKSNDQPTGGIGFFECIEDQQVANLLFDTAKEWLEDLGMEAMDGPINFGDRDKWWGLLVDGFHLEPNYQCNYHKPYYRFLFENYGFEIYFKQFTFIREIADPVHIRIEEKAEKVRALGEYQFRHIRRYRLSHYAEEFRIVYNKAWSGHDGVAEMSKDEALAIMKQLKPVLDEKLIWFAYYQNEPVAFFVGLPEVNQIFKYMDGELNLIGKIKFLLHRLLSTNKKVLGLVFGVVPEHQGKGLDGALIWEVAKFLQKKYQKYETIEMNWIGDFNRKMLLVLKQVGGDIGKTHHTYRYLFDRSRPFSRLPIK